MLIYVALMAEAFTGCLPPWGQMAYLGAQVIISLLDVIPGINYGLEQWLRGDIAVSGTTLNRFFALHIVAVPLALIGLVVFHLVAPPTILRHPPVPCCSSAHCTCSRTSSEGWPMRICRDATVSDDVGALPNATAIFLNQHS